ncbi:MAG: hypothetical protein ACU84H_17415 [Gammaproteobacteria bacterium]
MATINRPLLLQVYLLKDSTKNPALLAGFFILAILLSGCQAVKTPEQVTAAFWQAMARGDVESARKQATQESRHLISRQQNLENAEVQIGTIVIDGLNATVETILTLKKPENNKPLTFNTALVKEKDQWKVDYQQTLNNLLNRPFAEIFKSLRTIGDTINKQLEQQIPLIEKEIKSFSEELIKELEEFNRQLEKNAPPQKQAPLPGTI